MQIHKKIFIVALVLSICISLYFLINPSNIFTFPIRVHEFDDTFKYYMFVKIGIVLLFHCLREISPLLSQISS